MSTNASSAAVAGPTVSEPLTWAEICEKYPEQWVCLVEIDSVDETDRGVRSARVCGHGKTRGEPLAQVQALWASYDEIGHFFTGLIRAPFPRVL